MPMGFYFLAHPFKKEKGWINKQTSYIRLPILYKQSKPHFENRFLLKCVFELYFY